MNQTITFEEACSYIKDKQFKLHLKSANNAALHINFVESIRQEVDNVRSELGNSMITVSVVEAVTQTDCVICYHALWNGVDKALANDGDFIAGAGKKMMLIKDFKMTARTAIK